MADTTLELGIATLITTVAGFAYTWFREGRTRRWQQQDAQEIAEKANSDAKILAEKVNSDAAALAAKQNADAIALASKLIHDASDVAAKLHDNAEKLAAKVAENTTVSTDAAKGAKEAYSEANSTNRKIADLQTQLLKIGEHVERTDQAAKQSEQAIHEEALYNQRVKEAVEKTLAGMNGMKEQLQRKRKPR